QGCARGTRERDATGAQLRVGRLPAARPALPPAAQHTVLPQRAHRPSAHQAARARRARPAHRQSIPEQHEGDGRPRRDGDP
ncbi:hypothetical protein PFISCL1PPCAC_28952, partial [Pristionchus fissidentatus]